ncbi:Flp pilus assembly protein TadG [Afifella marina DSM 2698]|uniref:Flp pilus assembly protein TadG n=2 Tax=Afifella marina TaxID=1080 RepID=A0A1G5NQ85_AFIMA|nr:Flp pilus assembly protein TadG [Afifella marina DSM 2698]
MLCSLRRLFHRYLRREDGSVAPLIGFSALGLIALMGFAVDVGRAQFVQAKLLNAADAGGLAAGSRINSTNVQEEVEQFVRANFPDGYADAHIVDVKASVNAAQTTITVNASAKVPTTFMRLLGFKSLTVSAYSEVTREMGGLEVVMVLDNTGSMLGTKLSSLKNAANELINILFGDDSVGQNLYVGLVPFSQAVNIGPANSSWLSPDPSTKDFAQSEGYHWNGCVEARPDGEDVTDTPPTRGNEYLFAPYWWPYPTNYSSTKRNETVNNWARSITTPGACTRRCVEYFWFICTKYEETCEPDDVDVIYNTPFNEDFGPNKNCPQELTPMTSSKQSILGAINSMKAVGGTHINLGAVWGWRMLSPSWRGLWGGDMAAHGLPLDYDNELMDKAVIIMTDGQNTEYGKQNSNPDVYFYSAYKTLPDDMLGTTWDANAAAGELDDRLEAVCTSMKNAGILVYTIAFGSDVDNSTKSMMRRCATQSEYFFDSPSSSELTTAFKQIGDSLSELRVSR